MKRIKYTLLSILLISSASFATATPQKHVTLSSLLDVISFCNSDKSCNSIKPVIDESEIKYAVTYENTSQVDHDTPPVTIENTDPAGGGI